MRITKQFLNYTFVAVNTLFLTMPTQKKKKQLTFFAPFQVLAMHIFISYDHTGWETEES